MLVKIKFSCYIITNMAPMSDEAKSKLLQRLKEGRARVKAARDEAKAAGKPDPKPRKARKSKTSDGALKDPAAAPAANENIAPIDGAPRQAVNAVAAAPVDPGVTKSKPIDVPNLPGEGKKVDSKKDIVPDAAEVPVAVQKKGLSSTGRPKKANVNNEIVNEAVGNTVIPAQYPGQKESIKKLLDENKKDDKPLTPASQPDPPSKTLKKVKSHVPDVKATEGREPFSFSAIRKMLHQ
jgi:hypothetical protein